MNFAEKISIILNTNELGISSPSGLEEFIGAGKGAITTPIKKGLEPGRATQKKIVETLRITYEWWNTGKGQIFNKPDSVKELAKEEKLIPFYDAVAVGGNSILADQTSTDMPTEMINPGTWFRTATGSLRVYGHSMFPKYPSGSIIAFKKGTLDLSYILYGEDYVIELEDRRIIKRVQKSKEKGYIQVNSYNSMKDDVGAMVYAPVDIPMTAIKRMYMVLGKIELEASI